MLAPEVTDSVREEQLLCGQALIYGPAATRIVQVWRIGVTIIQVSQHSEENC